MSELSPRRRALVLAICCISILVVVMDISIVNVALSAIREDLRTTTAGLQWTVDAYTLVLAGFLVVAARALQAIGVFGSVSGLALALGPILGGALVAGSCS